MAGRGRKVWTEETLAVPDLQDYLQDQSVMVFTNTADRSAQIPAPTEGMVSYLTSNDSMWLFDGVAWRRLNGAGQLLSIVPGTLVAAFSNAAGPGPITLGTATIPDPGVPYYVAPYARGEWGTAAAGTRWDGLMYVNNGGTDWLHGLRVQPEATAYGEMVPPGPMGRGGVGTNPMPPLVGASTVKWQSNRAYGSGGASFTAFNRAMAVWVYTAGSLGQ